MSKLMDNVNYIFDNRKQFRAEYADVIAKFVDLGIDYTTAEAMAITLAAKAKTMTDMAK